MKFFLCVFPYICVLACACVRACVRACAFALACVCLVHFISSLQERAIGMLMKVGPAQDLPAEDRGIPELNEQVRDRERYLDE